MIACIQVEKNKCMALNNTVRDSSWDFVYLCHLLFRLEIQEGMWKGEGAAWSLSASLNCWVSCVHPSRACFWRVSMSEFTVLIRGSFGQNKSSVVTKCHRAACMMQDWMSFKHTETKQCQDTSNGAFHH